MGLLKSKREKKEGADVDPLAVEIARLAQGTPIIGYHDENGQLIIPKEYDDGYDED